MKKMLRGLCFILAALTGLILWPVSADAAPEKEKTVRVAFPIQKGLTDLDEYGNYSGYTYEYLEEIAQYTGWDYEFVQVPGDVNESLTTLMQMVQDGEVDLMGGMLYDPALREQFDYASHDYGTVDTVLQVLYENIPDFTINSQVQQSFRIAVLSQSSRSVKELEEYCAMNLLTPEYVNCTSVEEQKEALLSGRADMMLNNSLNYVEGVRTIARFASKPFFFVTTKDKNTGLLEDLNKAIMSIEQSNPYFTTSLNEKYFMSTDNKLYLTKAEREYIKEAGIMKVAVLKEQPPYQYWNEEQGKLSGISVDLLDYVSKTTGLQFELVSVDTPDLIYQQMSQDEIKLVAGMPYNYDLARERRLSMSRPYVEAQYLILMKEDSTEASIKGKNLALTNAGSYKGEYLGNICRYDTLSDCIRAVEKGEADYTYVDAYTAQFYINMPEFRDLKMVPQTYEARKICFGVVKPGSMELLSILNKVIATIPDVDMQGIINQNSMNKQTYTIGDMIRMNPVEAILVLVAGFLAVIAVLSYFLRQRARMSKKTALELKKHFRLYALVNDYIFEYNHQTGKLLVSRPRPGKNSEPEMIDYNLKKESDPEEIREQKQGFVDLIMHNDGIVEANLVCNDGLRHWLKLAIEKVYDDDALIYVLGKINLIDEEMQERDELLTKARLDSLTHLYNAETIRNLIIEDLHKLKGEHGALMIIDVDHFKSVNDNYGHMSGDEVLRCVAQLLRSSFRADDIVGRPGGDEFVVYMRKVKDIKGLQDKCSEICSKARELLVENVIMITISVGAAMSCDGDQYEDLYQITDKELYEAKKDGRNGFKVAQRIPADRAKEARS